MRGVPRIVCRTPAQLSPSPPTRNRLDKSSNKNSAGSVKASHKDLPFIKHVIQLVSNQQDKVP